MKMLYVAVFTLLVLHAVDIEAAGSGYGSKWDYKVNSVMGPSKWKDAYGACGGTKNSPINILTKDVKINKDLSLTLHDYNQIGGNYTFSMSNRQTDIGFAGKSKSSKNLPQSVTFKGIKYRFYQFHFHWGVENHKGSEHLLNSQRAAAELHMIHQNTKYAKIGEAIDQTDGLLVWGHFLVVNSKDSVDNAAFQELLDQFSKVANDNGSKAFDVNVNLFKLLPKEHDHFFTYHGGLTTPPCHESVRWVVNRQPILVSEKQMTTFRTIQDKVKSTMISDNFRPPQPLGSRDVEANFDTADLYMNGAGMTIAPCFLTMLVIVAALFFNY